MSRGPTRKKTTAILTKLHKDFRYYADQALKIRPKDPKPGAGVVPLKLNTAQKIFMEAVERQLLATGRVRAVVLKGRQQGLSTVIEGKLYHFVSQRQGVRGMVVTHKTDATTALFTMTNRYHNNVTEFLKPSTTYSSKKELVFDKLDSSITVGTAGGDGLGRSETIQFLHASELAIWPANSAEEIWSGLMDTLPPVDDSWAIAESTARGNSGVFYDLYQNAKAGLNEFIAIFIPWAVQAEYRMPAPEGFERTFDEEEYAARYDRLYGDMWWYSPIDNDQLFWRRMKIGEKGAAKFKQEYPIDDEEAFQSSGMQLFPPERVGELRQTASQPIATKVLIGDRWEEHRTGPLTIFKPHDHGTQYTIGADVGHGLSSARADADYSVAQVLDEHKEQVAILRARVLPGDFAHWLYHLGMFYNEAEIVVENASPGYHTVQRLSRDLLYPRVYTEEIFDKVSEQFTTKLGWTPSVKSKPTLINKLRDAVANKSLKVNCLATINEMRTFIATPTGKYEADKGAHDDTIIALGLALHVWSGPRVRIYDYEYIDPEVGIHDNTPNAVFMVEGFSSTDHDTSVDSW